MPTIWVAPDVAVTHDGVTVYHAYKEGTDTRLYNWYQLDVNEQEGMFDIRDLVSKHEDLPSLCDNTHEQVLRAAIDLGLLENL